MKKLIVFDLDGTLAESKSSLDSEMATLLSSLLGRRPGAISVNNPGVNLHESRSWTRSVPPLVIIA